MAASVPHREGPNENEGGPGHPQELVVLKVLH